MSVEADEFFSDSYVEARGKFGAACEESGVGVSSLEHPSETGPKGETLAIDVAVFGRADAPNMILINTGTHGLEGFCGSAIVTQWIRRREYERLGANVGAVIVHGLNPWGFAHLRRTTENNVDLNRNFIDHTTPYPDNPRYGELHGIVCPSAWSEAALAEAKDRLDAYAEIHGRDTMMDALIRGQYSHADGMNYGGSGREWSNLALEKICAEHLAHARHLGFIDWHTGIGEHGELVFLCFNEEGGELHRRAGEWWGAENVARDAAFASAGRKRPDYKGLVFYGVQQFLPGAEMAGAVIEYGTRGSPPMYKALRLDRWLQFETDRWSPENADKVEDLFDSFCPRAEEWRRGVLDSSLAVTRAMCEGLASW
ncbi:MAG: M14 family metallopeptidase [Rhodospirillales bacterium]|nr:M14 family metallopeptidase [Rhodospirillales bacterium]MDP6772699.1 M14 family metallopeptidase [Rhodospirillales bacterium]